MKTRYKLLIVLILLIFAFLWIEKDRQKQIGLLTQPSANVTAITITPQSNLLPNKKVTLSTATPQLTQLLEIITATELQTVKKPTEQNAQVSSPAYTLRVKYKDGQEDVILATETGAFLYRIINEIGGWVGGKNDVVLPYLQALLSGMK